MRIVTVAIMLLISFKALADNEDYEVKFSYDKSNVNYSRAKNFWLEHHKDLNLDDGSSKIGIDVYDIDDDGIKEIISTLEGKDYCGSGGCMISIIKPSLKTSDQYTKIFWHQDDTTLSTFLSSTMKILKTTTNNFHDIVFPHNTFSDYFKWNKDKNMYELSK